LPAISAPLPAPRKSHKDCSFILSLLDITNNKTFIMRFDTTLVQAALCLASWSSVTAAWPDSFPEADGGLAIRQNNDGDKETTSKDESEKTSITKAPESATKQQPKETTSADNDNDNKDEDKDVTSKESGKPSQKSTAKSSTATRTRFPADSPPGGVTMATPVLTVEPTPLYKIGRDIITFGWNYTSLRGTPHGIDVLVSCQEAQETWTLTTNMTFQTNASYLWDTKKQATDAQAPLVNDLYTLIIKDSDTDITDLPSPGYLAAYTGMTFGLYEPAEPTAWKDWKCNGCSAAPSLFERPALGLAVSMSLISVASFTWFVTGLV
jgi:hypothetical protein